jgi:hypothetical protein
MSNNKHESKKHCIPLIVAALGALYKSANSPKFSPG